MNSWTTSKTSRRIEGGAAIARGLLVGRFQPFHLGHLGVIQALRAQRPEEALIIGVGSAQESHTWMNPFSAGERLEMIYRALLTTDTVPRWTAIPLEDIHRHGLWVAHLESLLPRFERVYTNNPLTRLLFERAGYEVESPPLVERGRFEGAQIRERMADGESWADLVPPAVAAYLESIRATERLALLRPPSSGSSSR